MPVAQGVRISPHPSMTNPLLGDAIPQKSDSALLATSREPPRRPGFRVGPIMTQDRTHTQALAVSLSLITAGHLTSSQIRTCGVIPSLGSITSRADTLPRPTPFPTRPRAENGSIMNGSPNCCSERRTCRVGARGLVLLQSLIFCGFVGGLFWLYWSRWRNALFIMLLGVYSIPLLSVLINIRPHSFTYLLVVIFLLCIDAYTRVRKRWIYVLAPDPGDHYPNGAVLRLDVGGWA